MARLTEGTQNLVLSGIADPRTDSDAANRRYVDEHAGVRPYHANYGLTQDDTDIAVDSDVIASRRYVDSEIAALVEHDTTYTAGYGLNLSADSEFSVDSDTIASVRRLNAEIAALPTMRELGYGLDSDGGTTNVDTDVIASRRYVDSIAEHDTTYTAGNGLNLSSDSEFSVDTDTIATRAFVLAQHDSDTTYARFDTDSDGLVRSIGHQAATGRPLNRYFLNATNEWVIPIVQVETNNNNTADSDGVILRLGHDLNTTFHTPIYFDDTSTIIWDTDQDTISRNTGGARLNAHVDTDTMATRQWVRDNTHGGSGHYGTFTEDSDGLVPHPGRRADNETRFLNGNGAWATVTDHIDIHDTETLIRALHDVENSRWLPNNHSIETYGTISKVVTPAVPGTGGSFAEFNLIVTHDPGQNPGDDQPLNINSSIPIRYPDTNGNIQTANVALNSHTENQPVPNPPRGARDVAVWIANTIGQNFGSPDGNGMFYEIDRGTPDGQFSIRMDHVGHVDTDGANALIGQWNQGDNNYYLLNIASVTSPGTNHTPGTPEVDTDSDIVIWDQPIPQFGTTEQGNATYQPGLVPQPDILQRNDSHFLTGLGTWVHGSTISGGGDSSWRGEYDTDTDYGRDDVAWNMNDNIIYRWDSDSYPDRSIRPHLPGGTIFNSQAQITRLSMPANLFTGTLRVGIYNLTGGFTDTDIAITGAGNPNTMARLITEGINAAGSLNTLVTASNLGSAVTLTWDSDREVPTGSTNLTPPPGVARNGVRLDNPTAAPAVDSFINATLNREIQDGFVNQAGRNHWVSLGERTEGIEYNRDSDTLTIFTSDGSYSVGIADTSTNIQHEIDALQEELNAGIGAIPVQNAGDLRGPRDFTSWSVNAAGTQLTLGVSGDDSDGWSAVDDEINDLLFPVLGTAALHFKISYVNSGDTTFREQNLVFITQETAASGSDVFTYNESANTITFNLLQARNTDNQIAVTDGAGNVTGNAAGLSGGAGYFRHVYAYNSQNREADIADQFNSIGVQNYNYGTRYDQGIPIVITEQGSQEPHISIAGLGTGLYYDTDTNTINVDQTEDTENYIDVVRNIDVFGISTDSTNPIQYNTDGLPTIVPVTIRQRGVEVLHTKVITYASGVPTQIAYHLGSSTGPRLAVKDINYDSNNRVVSTPISSG